MRLLYNFIVFLYQFGITLASYFGNEKAKQWVDGRQDWRERLKAGLSKSGNKKRYWFHCASLGEFEQGRPLIEKVRAEFPDAFIILSFFSPSGFENKKNYTQVDYITYLPSDSESNARDFLSILKPEKVFFIKYEFWYNYISEIRKRSIPFYVVSAIFRPDQIFFKSYGKFFRDMLSGITIIFVQDKNSAELLESIELTNVKVSGDTRFDRVAAVAKSFSPMHDIEEYSTQHRVIVGGSTWPGDDIVLLDLYRSLEQHARKLILVPHEPDEKHLKVLESTIAELGLSEETIRYSQLKPGSKKGILIIDKIGMLSRLYHYADITYVGGGFGKGIHNILEAAAHNKAVLFGPNYGKFREAHELQVAGGAFAIKNSNEATIHALRLLLNENELKTAGQKAGEYVRQHTGATGQIFKAIFNPSHDSGQV